jgi:hypothetical protein
MVQSILISTDTYTYTHMSVFFSNQLSISEFCCYNINQFHLRSIRWIKYSRFKSWMILICLIFSLDDILWLHVVSYHFNSIDFISREIVSIQIRHSISSPIIHFFKPLNSQSFNIWNLWKSNIIPNMLTLNLAFKN